MGTGYELGAELADTDAPVIVEVHATAERRETASALEEAYGEDVVVGNALKAVTNP